MLRGTVMVRASIWGPEGFVVLTQGVPCLREASTTAGCVAAVYLSVSNSGSPRWGMAENAKMIQGREP